MADAVLHGDTSAFRLPDVLTFLSTSRKSGTLTVACDGREAWLYFQDGAMVYTPAISRQEYVQADVKALIEQHGDLALSEFARQVAEMDPERRAALRRLAGE